MIAVLVSLRADGFNTFIISGCGVEFIPAFTKDRSGVPPEKIRDRGRDGIPKPSRRVRSKASPHSLKPPHNQGGFFMGLVSQRAKT
jgi:hypothetical protein